MHVHHTAVFRHDAVHDTQAESRPDPFFLGCEERIPDTAEQRRRNAGAVVGHADHCEGIVVDGRADVELERRLDHRAFTAHGFQRLSRIHHQVQHHLLEPTRVTLHVHRLVREREQYAHTARVEGIPLRIHDMPDHPVQVDQLAARHVALSCKCQQVTDDAFCAARLTPDRLQRLAIIVGPRATQQQLRKSADGRERIVQLVRDTRQHMTE